jgi:hypothetical protein
MVENIGFGRKVCPNGCVHDVEDCLCGCEVCQAWDSGIEESDEVFDDGSRGWLFYYQVSC